MEALFLLNRLSSPNLFMIIQPKTNKIRNVSVTQEILNDCYKFSEWLDLLWRVAKPTSFSVTFSETTISNNSKPFWSPNFASYRGFFVFLEFRDGKGQFTRLQDLNCVDCTVFIISKQWIKGSLVNFICKAKSVSKQDVQCCVMTRNHAFQVGYFYLFSLSHSSY